MNIYICTLLHACTHAPWVIYRSTDLFLADNCFYPWERSERQRYRQHDMSSVKSRLPNARAFRCQFVVMKWVCHQYNKVGCFLSSICMNQSWAGRSAGLPVRTLLQLTIHLTLQSLYSKVHTFPTNFDEFLHEKIDTASEEPHFITTSPWYLTWYWSEAMNEQLLQVIVLFYRECISSEHPSAALRAWYLEGSLGKGVINGALRGAPFPHTLPNTHRNEVSIISEWWRSPKSLPSNSTNY